MTSWRLRSCPYCGGDLYHDGTRWVCLLCGRPNYRHAAHCPECDVEYTTETCPMCVIKEEARPRPSRTTERNLEIKRLVRQEKKTRQEVGAMYGLKESTVLDIVRRI